MKVINRIRTSPRLVIASAVGVALVVGWVGWAIYATTQNGASEGIGVLIAWPVLIAAGALLIAPFVIGGLLLFRRDSGATPAIAGGGDAEESNPDEDE
jgi:hypothetical protein